MITKRQLKGGFTLIELLIVIAVIAILAAMAAAGLTPNRQAANETSAVSSMRKINWAETSYRSSHNQYCDLPTLLTANLVTADMVGPGKSGYTFLVQGTTMNNYFVTAAPMSATSGIRSYYTDEVGVIFQSAPTGSTPPTSDTSGQTPVGYGPVGN